MKYLLTVLLFGLFFIGYSSNVNAQDEPEKTKKTKTKKDKNKGQGTQEDLDKENADTEAKRMTPEQKAYMKKMAEDKKRKQKNDEVTRKRAAKVHDQRLNKAKGKVSKKKKGYLKTHG